MRKAVVTGASGFVGSHLIKELVNNGVEVFAIIKDERKNIDSICFSNVKIIYYNLKDHYNLDEIIIDRDIDVFYHLAWAGVSAENKNNFDMQYDNIRLCVNALTSAKKINCSLFIGAGTVAEYMYCDKPMNDSFPVSPADAYGAAKASSKLFCNVMAKQLGQNMIWTILPSVYGEGREGENILTYTIRTLLRNDKPSFTKLEQLWDFLYVGDLAKALYMIGIKGKHGETYGIGSGIFKPMRFYIETIRDIINKDLPIGIGDIPYLNDRIPSSCVDTSKLSTDTGFIPSYTFEQGIKKTIKWYNNKKYL